MADPFPDFYWGSGRMGLSDPVPMYRRTIVASPIICGTCQQEIGRVTELEEVLLRLTDAVEYSNGSEESERDEEYWVQKAREVLGGKV